MPQGYRSRSFPRPQPRRQPLVAWPLAAFAIGAVILIALAAWLALRPASASLGEDMALGEGPGVPAAPAPHPAGVASRVNGAGKGDRLSALAASPGGLTWVYLTRDVIESRPLESRPLEMARVMPPRTPVPPLDQAIRSEAPAFISRKVASLSPTAPFDTVPMDDGATSLIGFRASAFPYDGINPRTQSGRYSGGRYGDNRVLVHIPRGFDARKPAVMVVFFHGHGATLARDVRDRQQLPRQISESGVNAVLVAPQFAVDAADSSAGKFWERGGMKRFLDEAAEQLAELSGNPRSAAAFARMPVVLVAYSGGFAPAAWALQVGGAGNRIKGLVLLDALYGEMDKFSSWIMDHRSAFFVSAYTRYTARNDESFAQSLRNRGLKVVRELKGPLEPGTVAFLETSGLSHRDFVNRAWAPNPISDLLVRMAQR